MVEIKSWQKVQIRNINNNKKWRFFHMTFDIPLLLKYNRTDRQTDRQIISFFIDLFIGENA